MTITRDAMRAVHLGERLDEGMVTWSGNTRDKTLALITAKPTDAVGTFLDPHYVQAALRQLERDAGHELADSQEAVQTVSQRLRFTEAQQADILAHFIRGGDVTAGGILHAVTSVARTLADADAAHEMESQGLRALEIAAAL
jgi:predicted ATPase with chaperone activity